MQTQNVGRWPMGLIGMLALVLAVELHVSEHDREYTTLWAQNWKWSQEASSREAARSEILCLGDSLVLHGVLPRVLESHLHRRAYNLALFKGQAASTYVLLRRALAAGTKPSAILIDGELLEDDPMELTRLWPELLSLRECGELAVTARSPSFFALLAVSKLLPSCKSRWEIRANVSAALAGMPVEDRTKIRPRRRNSELNRGAQVLPVSPDSENDDSRDAAIAQYTPPPWNGHRLNRIYIDRLLALAASRDVPVYWLLPPYHPGIQARRETGGWDGSYMEYVASLQARYANLTVIDGRHAGYTPRVMADMTHLNRLGAVAFTTSIAGVLGPRLDNPAPAAAPRWVAIPAYHEPADASAIEDVIASATALRQQRAGKTTIRR